MRCTRLKLAMLVAISLSTSVFAADAWAACRVVKVNPNCWGDTCPTRQVCSPAVSLSQARVSDGRRFKRPR